MTTKFTPEHILEMLKAIKTLCHQSKFNSKEFLKLYPSYYSFRKVLKDRGILFYEKGKPKWVTAEPNLIMAKSVLSSFLYNKKANTENKKMDSITKEEHKVDLNKISFIESLEAQLNSLKAEYGNFKESQEKIKKDEIKILNNKIIELNSIIYEKKDSVDYYVKANEILDQKIIENNELINNFKTKAEVRTKSLKEKEKLIIENNELIINQNAEILELNHLIRSQSERIQELKDAKNALRTDTSTSNGSTTKIVRFFGIPIYSCETK